MSSAVQANTLASHPKGNSDVDTTWTQSIVASFWGLFSGGGSGSGSETEADAVEAWVGIRKGRGRCRSVGEVR
ncbi:hypothetical protein N7456_004492 [Penicillium angulare]|uniref:Uncharacterized protein n=1 Tax=Penicillium angulare TaxID=116970 RepID=A0A9W9FWN2_9EURO|nr:hypothetical protein N7456_004492 [Penicillium angulare]